MGKKRVTLLVESEIYDSLRSTAIRTGWFYQKDLRCLRTTS